MVVIKVVNELYFDYEFIYFNFIDYLVILSVDLFKDLSIIYGELMS